MDWIQQFFVVFFFPLGIYTFACLGWYWSDNTSYPWKHWPRTQAIGMFSFGPVASFVLTGLVMIGTLSNQEPVFERWFVAVTLLALATYVWRRYTRFALIERSQDEKDTLRKQWVAAGSPLP